MSCIQGAGPAAQTLTGDEEHDSCYKGAVESLKGGEVGEGHDACDDARETRHPRQNHERPGCIPVGCEVREEGLPRLPGKSRSHSCALGWHFLPWEIAFLVWKGFYFILLDNITA